MIYFNKESPYKNKVKILLFFSMRDHSVVEYTTQFPFLYSTFPFLSFIFNQHVKPYYNMLHMAPGAEPSNNVLKVQSPWVSTQLLFHGKGHE